MKDAQLEVKDGLQRLSIAEAASRVGVTRQAIYIAIKLNKLKAEKAVTSRWTLLVKDLEEYSQHRYSRDHARLNGVLLFDHSLGLYSVRQAAQLLAVPPQKIYYAIRSGHITATRRGSAWVLHMDAIQAYKAAHLQGKSS
jgi:excisionase family DNA binding protein